MNEGKDRDSTRRPKRIGQYLKCDSEALNRGLERQREWAAEGIKKPVGEVLLELGVIDKESLREAVQLQRLDRLRTGHLFNGVADSELEDFCDFVSEKSVEAGEIFIPQNSTSDCFYVIVEGEAEVYRIGENDHYAGCGQFPHTDPQSRDPDGQDHRQGVGNPQRREEHAVPFRSGEKRTLVQSGAGIRSCRDKGPQFRRSGQACGFNRRAAQYQECL